MRIGRSRALARAGGPLCVVLLAAASLLLAACGGSSPAPSASAAAGGSQGGQNTLAGPARGTVRPARGTASAGANPGVVSGGAPMQRPLRGTGGDERNDDNPGSADSGDGSAPGVLDPCTLVSRAQAEAIVGRLLAAPQEAPLGPTCIYQPRGAGMVTVAVEPLDLSQLERQLRDRRRLTVGGHAAYCGRLGQPLTLVPLSGGRALSVTAPCAAGARFAAAALSRLPA
jgi:hypothetical protein